MGQCGRNVAVLTSIILISLPQSLNRQTKANAAPFTQFTLSQTCLRWTSTICLTMDLPACASLAKGQRRVLICLYGVPFHNWWDGTGLNWQAPSGPDPGYRSGWSRDQGQYCELDAHHAQFPFVGVLTGQPVHHPCVSAGPPFDKLCTASRAQRAGRTPPRASLPCLYDTAKMLRFGADQVEVWCNSLQRSPLANLPFFHMAVE